MRPVIGTGGSSSSSDGSVPMGSSWSGGSLPRESRMPNTGSRNTFAHSSWEVTAA